MAARPASRNGPKPLPDRLVLFGAVQRGWTHTRFADTPKPAPGLETPAVHRDLATTGASYLGCSPDSSFVGGGGLPAVPGEGSSERSDVVETHGDGDLEDGTVQLGQQGHRRKHASAE